MTAAAPSPPEIAALIASIRTQLAQSGSVNERVDDLTVPVDVWRRAARRAARELGRPVTTLLGPGLRTVHAVLSDWPANDAERRVHAAALRSAVNATAAADKTRQ